MGRHSEHLPPDPAGRETEEPPPQYGVDGRCERCGARLSRYNPNTFCSMCRQRELPARILDDEVSDLIDLFPRRRQQRGSE